MVVLAYISAWHLVACAAGVSQPPSADFVGLESKRLLTCGSVRRTPYLMWPQIIDTYAVAHRSMDQNLTVSGTHIPEILVIGTAV